MRIFPASTTSFVILSILLISISFAQLPLSPNPGGPAPSSPSDSELTFRTNIQAGSNYSSTSAYARLIYINYSKYVLSHPENFPTFLDDFFDPSGDYSYEEIELSTNNLEGAPLHFTFDGMPITDSAGMPACFPLYTDSGGRASCKVEYYNDSTGTTVSFFNARSCGNVEINFPGFSRDGITYQPSSQRVMLCPPSSFALSAFGTALTNGMSNNWQVCFPLMLILGLLVSSLYYSGKDPLSLLDLTTPRIPKGKPYRISGGTAPMMLRSLGKTLANNRRITKVDIGRVTDGYFGAYARAAGLDKAIAKEKRAELKKALRNLLAENEKIVRAITNETKDPITGKTAFEEHAYGETQALIMMKYAKLMEQYNPNEMVKHGLVDMKRFEALKRTKGFENVKNMYENIVMNEVASKLSINMSIAQTEKMLASSRPRKGGKFKKFMDKSIGKLTDLEIRSDAAVNKVRVPLVGPLVRGVMYAPAKLGWKAFDALAQHRSSTLAAVSGLRDFHGALWYNAGHSKEGKRNMLGSFHKAIYDAGFGKVYAKYNEYAKGANAWDEYVKKYDIRNKVATPLQDSVENYRRLLISQYNALVDTEFSRVQNELLAHARAKGWGATQLGELKSILSGSRGRTRTEQLLALVEHLGDVNPNALRALGISSAAAYAHEIGAQESQIRKLLVYTDKDTGRLMPLSERSISDLAFNSVQKTEKNPEKAAARATVLREAEVKDFQKKYIAVGKMLSEELDINSRKTGGFQSTRQGMVEFIENANKNARAANASEDDYLRRFNPLGQHVAGAYMTEMLKKVLFDSSGRPIYATENGGIRISGKLVKHRDEFKISSINELEELFTKGVGSPQFRGLIQRALEHGALSDMRAEVEQHRAAIRTGQYGKGAAKVTSRDIDVDIVEAVLLERSLSKQSLFASSLYRTGRLAGASEKDIEKEIGDVKMLKDLAYVKKKAELNQAFEFATLREENELSDYHRLRGFGQYIENLLDANRRFTRLSGFLLSMKDKNSPYGAGGSWGDSFFGQSETNFGERVHAYNSMRAVFLNKIAKNGALYDEDFKKDLLARTSLKESDLENALFTKTMPFEAYKILQKRGITFQDSKSIEFFISGDGKGGVVLMEYDEDRLRQRYKLPSERGEFERGIIIEKSKMVNGKLAKDIRDLSGLMAEVMTSGYSNLQHHPMIETKNVNGKWQLTIPNDENKKKSDPIVSSLMEAAKANESMRTRIARALAGFDENGVYNAKTQKLRVLSLDDFREIHGTKRSDKVADAIGRFTYSAFYDRFEKMNEWYAVQAVTRNVMTQYLARSNAWQTEGVDRFKVDSGELHGGTSALDKLRQGRMGTLAPEGGSLASQKKWGNALSTLAEHASQEQPRFLLNLKRQFASKTMTAIAEAESLAIASNCEWKAIRKMSARDMGLTQSEYDSLRSEIESQRRQYKSDFKLTKKDYKEMNDVIVSWGDPYNGEYGSKRNLITRSWLFNKLLDSSPYTMGRWREYWFAVEAATMRSTDTAIGQRFGFSGTIATALETGQGAYEPTHMWLNSGMWEKSMIPGANFNRAFHRFFAPYASTFYRGMVGMPSYLQKTEMEGFEMGRDRTKIRQAVPKALLGPLWSNKMGDFMSDTKRRTFDLFGVSSALQAYANTQAEKNASSWSNRYIRSEHYHADAMSPSMQRPLDQFNEFASRLDTVTPQKVPPATQGYMRDLVLPHERNVIQGQQQPLLRYYYSAYQNAPAGSVEKEKLWQDVISKYIPEGSMVDHRPSMVQTAKGAGAYFFEDGSRNRFMSLFIAHHENIWRWIIPDMVELDPLGGVLNISPMVANSILNSRTGQAKGLGQYQISAAVDFKYDKETNEFDMTKYDYIGLDRESFRDVYNKNQSALLQALEFQSSSMSYTMWKPYSFVGSRMLGGAVKLFGGDPNKIWPDPPIDQQLKSDLGTNIGASLDAFQVSVQRRYSRWDKSAQEDYFKSDLPLGASPEDYEDKAGKKKGWAWHQRKWERMTDPYAQHNIGYRALIASGSSLTKLFGGSAATAGMFQDQFTNSNKSRKNAFIAFKTLREAGREFDGSG